MSLNDQLEKLIATNADLSAQIIEYLERGLGVIDDDAPSDSLDKTYSAAELLKRLSDFVAHILIADLSELRALAVPDPDAKVLLIDTTNGAFVYAWREGNFVGLDDNLNYVASDTVDTSSGIWQKEGVTRNSHFLYNTSDGSAPSQTAFESSYWTKDLLAYADYCSNRLKRLAQPLAPLKFVMAGNSIAEGTGASSAGFSLQAQLQFKLQNAVGGQLSDWAYKSIAIGSTTIATTALALSNVSGRTRGTVYSDPKWGYTVLISLRNEAIFNMSEVEYGQLLQQILINENACGRDVIFITEPPLLTGGVIVPASGNNPQHFSGGSVNETEKFIKLKNVALSLCAQFGATVIDAWQYFVDLAERGVDISFFSYDGTHPNNHQYAVIVQMLLECVLKQPATPAATNLAGSDYCFCVHKTVPKAGVTALTDLNATKSTARKALTGETTTKAYTLTAGQSVTFASDEFYTGILIDHVNSQGKVTVYNSNVIVTNGLSLVSPNSPGSFTNVARIFNTFSRWKRIGDIRIECTEGTVNITSIGVLCPQRLDDGGNPHYSELTNGWSDGVFTVTAENAKVSSTAGDVMSFVVSGSRLEFLYEQSDSAGKFEIYLDGLLIDETNCYSGAGTATIPKRLDMSEGLHYVEIKVTTADPASSANNVKIAQARYATSRPMLSQAYSLQEGSTDVICNVGDVRPINPVDMITAASSNKIFVTKAGIVKVAPKV